MNENQKFQIEHHSEFDNNAQNGEMTPTVNVTRRNGVYLLLNSGEIVPYTTDNCKNVKMIAIFHDGHSFGVPLDGDLGIHSLLKSNKHPMDRFCVNECQAILDWDFVKSTEHIQELGTDIPLKEGQYLPTAPVWLAMYANKDALNEALEDCGGIKINFSEDYWCAQRDTMDGARFFDGAYVDLDLDDV